MSRATDRREGRGWPGFLFGGRVRTSTLVLLIAFFATWWLFETYQPAPAPPEQVPATEVVPPGFIPDPAYTWAPRADVLRRSPTPTPTTTTPTTTETEAPTTTESESPGAEATPGAPSTPGPSTPVEPRSSETPQAPTAPVSPPPVSSLPVTTPPVPGAATSATPAPPAR
jgi:cytoskeletal protein RodZ